MCTYTFVHSCSISFSHVRHVGFALSGAHRSQPKRLIHDLGRCENTGLCQVLCGGVLATLSPCTGAVRGRMGNWAAKVEHCQTCNAGTICWWSLWKVHQQQRFHFFRSRTGRSILSLLLVSVWGSDDGDRSSGLWVSRLHWSSDPLRQARLL